MITTATNTQFAHKRKPWKHQDDSSKLYQRKIYAWFWEMGVGKSKAMLDHIIMLYLAGEIDGALILSDKGCYRGWEYDHAPQHIQEGINYRIACYSSSMRKAEEKKVEALLHAKDDCLDILCMNIESLVSKRAQMVAFMFLKSHYALMGVDEATSIKNHKAQRTKAATELGKFAEYKRIATGTPITNSPLDLYGMCEFLQKGLLGHSSWTSFRTHYGQWHTIDMGARGRFEKLVGYRCLDQLTASIQPFSSRILKSECLDLPPKVYETVYVEPTEEQWKYYISMKSMAVAEFGQGLMTSTSALTTLIRLHQIMCGHAHMDDKSTILLENNRVGVLMELLEKRVNDKTVIWAHYQSDIELIRNALREHKDFGHGSWVEYYGETSDNDRKVALHRMANDPKCSVFLGTPAAGGKGINDLVVADFMVYYSNHYNLERRLQSEDRLHRPGQKRQVTIVDLVCQNTVDVGMLENLKSKKDLAHQVLDQIRMLLGL